MSVWADVWAPTVWAVGVWYEGDVGEDPPEDPPAVVERVGGSSGGRRRRARLRKWTDLVLEPPQPEVFIASSKAEQKSQIILTPLSDMLAEKLKEERRAKIMAAIVKAVMDE